MRLVIYVCVTIMLTGCLVGCSKRIPEDTPQLRQARNEMVNKLQQRNVVSDGKLLRSLRQVPRHLFVPDRLRDNCYADQPLPAEGEEILSAPSLAATILKRVNPLPEQKMLMVNPPSGYMPALAAHLCRRVIVLVSSQARQTGIQSAFDKLALGNVAIQAGDLLQGWQAEAPYDIIILTSYGQSIPPRLEDQLAPEGIIVTFPGAHARKFTTMQLVDQELTPPRYVSVPQS